MATVNITIPAPIIVAPAYFKVRYRLANPLVGPATWIDLLDQTNAPFTIEGVTQGDWELGVTYVNATGEFCAEVLYPFEVGPPCDCLEITGVTLQRDVAGGPAYLNVSYTDPSSPAGCGYIVRYAQAGLPPLLTSKATVYFPVLTGSPLKIPVPGLVNMDVEILSDCCEGNAIACFSEMIEPDAEPAAGCDGVTIENTAVAIIRSRSTGQYHLSITYPGSSVVGVLPTLCNGMYAVATQIGVMGSWAGNIRPKPGELVTLPLPPTDFHPYVVDGKRIYRPLNPSPDVDFLGIRYNVAIHDCCGNVVYFPNIIYAGVQIP